MINDYRKIRRVYVIQNSTFLINYVTASSIAFIHMVLDSSVSNAVYIIVIVSLSIVYVHLYYASIISRMSEGLTIVSRICIFDNA